MLGTMKKTTQHHVLTQLLSGAAEEFELKLKRKEHRKTDREKRHRDDAEQRDLCLLERRIQVLGARKAQLEAALGKIYAQ